METTLSPREQGDIGELAALDFFIREGSRVYLPWGHSPDVDLIAERHGWLVRVQVKTSTVRQENGRYLVSLATRGGNQSWNKIVKRFSCQRCDALFAALSDGRRWLIPADHVEGGTAVVLGGPKYAEWEVEPWRPPALGKFG